MDINKLESDQAYATNNNEYPQGNTETGLTDVQRDSIIESLTIHYEALIENFYTEDFTSELCSLFTDKISSLSDVELVDLNGGI